MKKLFVVLIALLVLVGCAKKEEPVVEKKKVYMATEATFQPYEYYDGEEIIGIDVDIAKAICEKLGYELGVVNTDFDSIVPGVQAGKYDFGMAGMTVTEERLEKINFTTSYATGVQVVIIKEGSPITSVDDLFGDQNYTIGTQTGTTGYLYATWDIADEGLGTVVDYKKTTDAAQALVEGKIDCIILDNEPAKAICQNNSGLSILLTEYAVEDYAACIKKENVEFLNEFNTALEALIADGTVAKIVDKYIGD